jgi:hypothetical protein
VSELRGKFVDPWEGRGGFGGSTAEFAFAAFQAGIRTAYEAWTKYRELSAREPEIRRPSGVDLVVQWEGGTIEWKPPESKEIWRHHEGLQDLPALLFSATHLPNRKTATHAHLESLAGGISFSSLMPSLDRAIAGARDKDWQEIGRAFSAYADSLAHLGLESPVVRNERLALSRMRGVHGAKGCGSLQTDAMVVIVESLTSADTAAVIQTAEEECGLRLLSKGLLPELGMRAEGVSEVESRRG